MHKFLTIFSLLFSLLSISQNHFQTEDYSVTKGDLESNTYAKDSTAHALVIYEFGKSYIDNVDFKLKTEVKRKIKILDRDGFDEANISIRLYNDDSGYSKETISDIVATTNNLSEDKIQRSHLNKDQIFREKYNANNTLVKFTLPNIQVGSVITYSYTLESPFIFKFHGWRFQDDIPTLHSEYHPSIPAIYEYNVKLVGSQKLNTNTSVLIKGCLTTRIGGSANCGNSIYIMKDVPAFIDEKFMTTRDNYLSRVEYELKLSRSFEGGVKHYTKTWKNVDKELRTDKNIGRQFKKGSLVKDILPTRITSEPDALLKAKAIYNYVQEQYTWNERYRDDVSLKNLIKNKSGNVYEINLLLFNLLQEQGINVKTVLLSTRANGHATKVFPVLSDFNYIIVQASIDNEAYVLDAVDPYLSFGQLPFRCLNQYGRVLDLKDGSSWLDIEPSKVSTEQHLVELTLEDENAIRGTIKSKSTGYHAIDAKSSYFSNAETHLKAYKEKYPDIEFTAHQVSTESKSSYDFNETFHIQFETEPVGDNIYLDPFIFKFFTENPLKLQERSYPIDFGYKDTFLYSLKVNLNDKYELVEMPEEVTAKLPNNTGTLIFNTKVEGDTLLIFFKFQFKEAIYYPNFYPYLKQYFATIVDAQTNSVIVLKKK